MLDQWFEEDFIARKYDVDSERLMHKVTAAELGVATQDKYSREYSCSKKKVCFPCLS